MTLSKGAMGLYKTHHCKCNIITYLIKCILLSIDGLFILFTLGFPVRNRASLFQKMAFFIEHFMDLGDGLIVQPHYTLCHWVHAICIPLS